MKLHNLSVIFIVIAIPLILITSYYISLQIDTINMQTAYNTKLLDSTKEAIDAFEINTVEWNANYSETADSKRRDVMASINTFTTSFANNIGVGGTSKEYIMAYMPAIAYTLYDGYYIYSPANEKVGIKDDNGLGVVMTKKLWDQNSDLFGGYVYDEADEGKLLYECTGTSDGTYNGTQFTLDSNDAATEYKHILKPFAAYSERIGDWVINYTLDNYITIYGNIKDSEGNEEYVYKSGYLSVIGEKGIDSLTSNTVKNIKFRETDVEPEYLSEKIVYKDSTGTETTGVFNYVYEAEGNTKVYFDDSDNAFIVDSESVRTYLSEYINRYKKVTIPQYKSGKWTYKEVYQSLYDGKWYEKNKINEIDDITIYGIDPSKRQDYSAINYCVESYIVTKFVNSLENVKPEKQDGICVCGYYHGDEPLKISETNDPEKQDSDFCVHKRGIIKNVVESNLNQAITSYSRNTVGEYQLPKLTETDWNQILTNVSIITFIQNIPIGMKYYNNYAIATSTVNKEYVDPDEIYLNASGDNYYHMPYCTHLGTENLIGYRSIDYVQKSYKQGDQTEYYYKHTNNPNSINVDQACYYCLVQKSLYEKENNADRLEKKETAYNTALARERYVARMSKLPAEVEASYWIHVTPIYKGGGEETTAHTAQYTINSKTLTGENSEKISKTETNYSIAPAFGTVATVPTEGEGSPTEELGSFDNERTTIDSEGGIPDPYSVYKSNSSANVTINNYDAKGIQFNVTTVGDAKWTAGYSMDTTEQKYEFSSDQDGYINIELIYERNYKASAGTEGITAYANIDEKNKLTIVTNLGDVTGLVRLKFTNKKSSGESKIYYSSDIFDVKDQNSKIYCQIANDEKCWYEQDWKVEVLNVNNETIKETNKMEYYTIRNAKGLQGFAEATNEGAKTNLDDAKKTKPRYFYLISNIESVGEMTPICLSDGEGKSWFDGVFSGAYNEGLESATTPHYIKNITIKTDGNANHAFGMFGYIGGPGEVNDLVIDSIKIEGVTQNTYVGGLAGKADERQPDKGKDEIGKSIKNITVQNSTIKGTTYVGGIIGENKKELNNSKISSNTSVSSLGITNNKLGSIYVGGIAGHTENQIYGSTVEDSTIGSGNIKMSKKSSSIIESNCNSYYVGGITGYTTSTVNSSSVNNNSKVQGGKILIGSDTDDNGATYTGGVIGYKASNQKVDGNFSVGCTVSGHDNVGGIIGFNAGGDIDNVQFSGTISSGTGENIGGIVGCNIGGDISNCTNNIEIKVTGKSVGGIVGLNSDKEIKNCTNQAKVEGEKNVGGIAGLTHEGTISFCENLKQVTATNNSVIGKALDANDLKVFYNLVGENATGTGGIAGKIHGTKISCSYNEDKIICNFNGGGIVGVAARGTIEYCYNNGEVTNEGYRNENFVMNRLGGICGAGAGIIVNSCYNIGKINGFGNTASTPLKSPVGGIVGFLVDNTWWIGTTDYKLDTKYLDISIKTLTTKDFKNQLSYSYNAGEVCGDYSAAVETTHYNGGIIGFIGWGTGSDDIFEKIEKLFKNIFEDEDISSDDKVTIVECYFKRSDTTKRGTNNLTKQDKAEAKSENELKQILYKWATNDEGEGGVFHSGNYTYDTIAPLETGKGYEGYGILWWQLEDYVRLKIYMRVRDTEGNHSKIPNGLQPTITINGKSVEISDNNVNTYTDGNKYHNWTMMIPKDETYELSGKANGSSIKQIEPFIATSNETTKLIDLGGIFDRLIVHPSETGFVNWSDIITTIERYNTRIWPDSAIAWSGKHDVYVKYNGKIGDSKTEIDFTKDRLNTYNDNKFGSVFLDGDKLVKAFVLKNDPYKTYYTYKKTALSKGVRKLEDGSEWIQGKSSCVITIPIEDINGKKGEKGIVFTKDNSKIMSATAKLRVGIYVSDDFKERIGTRLINDDINVSVAFGNSKFKEVKRTIGNSYKYRKNNIDWLSDFTYQFSETSEVPDKIKVKIRWDANLVGIYLAIDYADVDVTYYTE